MNKKHSIAVAVLCLKPTTIWLDFLATFTTHHVYLIIDDESQSYADIYAKEYPTIHFIQIDAEKCKTAFFINMNLLSFGKPVTSWEKAMYYFQYENNTYDSVWYLEDDIFIYNESTLTSIDNKYPTSDLLTAEYATIYAEKYWTSDWWSIVRVQISGLELPYSNAMACGVRISKSLLCGINDYAQQHTSLFFLEALFSTLAKKYELVYDAPEEMNTIVYRRSWTIEDVSPKNIYHPVKNLQDHLEFRKSSYRSVPN